MKNPSAKYNFAEGFFLMFEVGGGPQNFNLFYFHYSKQSYKMLDFKGKLKKGIK
jgi:hypothetical protein